MFADIGRFSDPRLAFYALIAFCGLIALFVYFPVAIVREFRRKDSHGNPEWMGDTRSRRKRLLVIGWGFALAVVAACLFAMVQH